MQLEGKNLSFQYKNGDYIFKDINLSISTGERVALVAKSGYGKSTLAKVLTGYERPTKGQVLLDGRDTKTRGYNPVQLIHQHPEQAINPRWKMGCVLEESGPINEKLMRAMGIEVDWLERYSRELSGGELQKFSVLRALSKRTKFVIADEVSTMLDAITQAQIWNVMLDQAKKRNLGMLVVTHNSHLAKRICARIIELDKL